MNGNYVWEIISNIPIGVIISWVAVIVFIITAICTCVIKLYNIFNKYTKIKNENEKQKELLIKHEEVLNEINKSLREITVSLEEQKEVNLKQLRCAIVHICDEAISSGEISAGKLKSLEEMFEEYTDIFHANGYVKTLVCKARKIPVKGKLDE